MLGCSIISGDTLSLGCRAQGVRCATHGMNEPAALVSSGFSLPAQQHRTRRLAVTSLRAQPAARPAAVVQRAARRLWPTSKVGQAGYSRGDPALLHWRYLAESPLRAVARGAILADQRGACVTMASPEGALGAAAEPASITAAALTDAIARPRLGRDAFGKLHVDNPTHRARLMRPNAVVRLRPQRPLGRSRLLAIAARRPRMAPCGRPARVVLARRSAPGLHVCATALACRRVPRRSPRVCQRCSSGFGLVREDGHVDHPGRRRWLHSRLPAHTVFSVSSFPAMRACHAWRLAFPHPPSCSCALLRAAVFSAAEQGS